MSEQSDRPPLWVERTLLVLLGVVVSWGLAGASCMIASSIGNPVQCLCIEKKARP